VPVKGGSINELAPFLNLSSRGEFVLVVAWLLAALRHGGPYPLLAMSGEQGSAKTVLSKVLRALVDPNVAPVRTMPKCTAAVTAFDRPIGPLIMAACASNNSIGFSQPASRWIVLCR
jgi:hypothetical protein